MRQLPAQQENIVKPTHYRIKTLNLDFDHKQYKVFIAIGYLENDQFQEISVIDFLNFDQALIANILEGAHNKGKLTIEEAQQKLANIIAIHGQIEDFIYTCIEDLTDLDLVSLPRYYTF